MRNDEFTIASPSSSSSLPYLGSSLPTSSSPRRPRKLSKTAHGGSRTQFSPIGCICLLAVTMSLGGGALASSSSRPTRARPALVGEGTTSTSPARRLAMRAQADPSLALTTSTTSSSGKAGGSSRSTTLPSIITQSSGAVIGNTIATSSATSAKSSSSSSSSTGTASPTTTSSAPISRNTTVPAGYQLPQAFDSSVGTNYLSTACPSFFATFLANPTFVSCAPFSLLLSTSTAFFQAEQSPYSLLPFTLNASCTASLETCSALMTKLASEITHADTCGPDLVANNAVALEALNGFQNYPMMRESGCQKNNSTGQFCFAEAAAQSIASEIYFYYLPTGTSLPSGTTTKCESCTKGLMQIYSQYATNASLAISKTYPGARNVVSQSCGPTFAPLVAVATTGSATRPLPYAIAIIVGCLVCALSTLL